MVGRIARAPAGKDGSTVSHADLDITPKSATIRSMDSLLVTNLRGLLIQSSWEFELFPYIEITTKKGH